MVPGFARAREVLLQRLSFEELQTVLEFLGFELFNKGRTSGSRVKFLKGSLAIILHKPHPRKGLLEYQIMQIVEILEREELL